MAPCQVSVRVIDAEEQADVESLAELWVESRPVGRVPAAGRVDRSALAKTLGRAIARDNVKAFVASVFRSSPVSGTTHEATAAIPKKTEPSMLSQAIRRSGTRIMIWTSLWTSTPLMEQVHEKRVLSILSILLMELMNAGKSSNSKQRW